MNTDNYKNNNNINNKEENNRYKDIMFLLQFCMSDLNANTYVEMDKIKLLPLCDGHLGAIHLRGQINVEEKLLFQLRDMGFPYQIAWSALQKHKNNIETSSMWLLGLQNQITSSRSNGHSDHRSAFQDEAWDEAPYYICSEIENKLLIGDARRAVIDINKCPPRVEQILKSKMYRCCSNTDY